MFCVSNIDKPPRLYLVHVHVSDSSKQQQKKRVCILYIFYFYIMLHNITIYVVYGFVGYGYQGSS